MSKVIIGIATQKKVNYSIKQGYFPIFVGADLKENILGYQGDNQGENISNRNRNFCELTALYWMWKNLNCDVKGLYHYRRVLSTKHIWVNSKYFVDASHATKDLGNYDIILPLPWSWKKTCKDVYIDSGGMGKDIENLLKIINEYYPEYMNATLKILNGNSASYCNIMLCKEKVFNEYCEWLFKILFLMAEVTDLTGYTAVEARIYGFLSELLLNVWVLHKNLKVKHYPIVQTDTRRGPRYYLLGFLKNIKKSSVKQPRL